MKKKKTYQIWYSKWIRKFRSFLTRTSFIPICMLCTKTKTCSFNISRCHNNWCMITSPKYIILFYSFHEVKCIISNEYKDVPNKIIDTRFKDSYSVIFL